MAVCGRSGLSWLVTASALHWPGCLQRVHSNVGRPPKKSSAPGRVPSTVPGVALVARVRDDVPDVPPHEQWLCVGAALMNFMNALHLMGFGAKALSGASVSDPAVHTAFCGPGERLANWVIAGRPVRAAHPKAGAEASAVISGWRMDQG